MSHAKRRLLPAIMACAVGFGASAALADATGDQMQQKIDSLEAKVQSLEASQTANQADVTAAIQHVIADADKHSQMMGSVMGGTGYDSATGFHIGSDDGNFMLHPFALFQFRGAATYRDAVNPAATGADVPTPGSHTEDGFEIRRLKFGADGHVYSPDLKYFFQFDTNRAGGGVTLDDAYATYKVADHFTIKGGQFKDFAWHESNVDDGHQLAAEQSLVNALIGGTVGGTGGFGGNEARVQGIDVMYTGGPIHAQAALHDGYASQNTKFFDASVAPGLIQPSNFGVSGRAEYMIFGDHEAWEQYDSFSAMGARSELLVVGGGFDWTEASSNDAIFWTADAQYDNPNGLDAYAAFLGQYIHSTGGAGLPHATANSYGFLVQAGYLITPKIEPFVRYDFTHLDDGLYSSLGAQEHNIHEITVGVNYYLYGHRAKFTVDGTWLPNGSPVDADGLGILTDNHHNELIARVQFQLLI